jgi:hypothetical protein
MVRRALVVLALVLGACTAQQVTVAQQDQAVVQAVLNAACADNALEQIVASAVPEVGFACVGGRVSAAVVTAVLNNPVFVGRLIALSAKIQNSPVKLWRQ